VRHDHLIALALVALCCAGACSGAPSDDEVRETLTSWSATIRTAEHAWLRHDVPTRFVVDVLSAAGDALQGEEESLAGAEHTTLRRRCTELRALIQPMRDAISRRDDAALRGHLEALARFDAQLRSGNEARAGP
jgi:hypothetical protein